MHRLPLLLGMVLLGLGCDARAPEPPVTREASAQSTGTGSPATSSKPRKGRPNPPVPARCITPTPPEPQRVYTGKIPAEGCPEDPGPRPELARKKVEIPNTANGTLVVDAEIAAEDEHRQRGLMYRTSLGENEGMLFIFEQQRDLTFWMRNTCLPLDMLFLATDGTIVGIQENTPTLTDENFSPGCPAKYVLEVNAGWTRKNGVRAGMKVNLPK